jgi:zinc and cadmium transporter
MLIEIIFATLVVSAMSLVGISLISLDKKTMDNVVFIILSFAIGTLLAATFFDLFPEALESGDSQIVFGTALAGILTFFILERLVHWHHEHHDHSTHEKPVAWLVVIGDGVHNFFDGVAISASFLTSMEVGITTTFAIIVHEIPQELSDFTLLRYAGFSTKKALAFNLISALASVMGAVFFFYASEHIENIEPIGLAFTAGAFLYIAATDLLPELHKEEEKSKSIIQLVAMLLGIATIWLIVNFVGG